MSQHPFVGRATQSGESVSFSLALALAAGRGISFALDLMILRDCLHRLRVGAIPINTLYRIPR